MFFVTEMTDEQVTALKLKIETLDEPYRIVVESCTKARSTFLDLSIFKGFRWAETGYPDVHPWRKPTATGLALSGLSHHPLSVHRAWPLARSDHFLKVSTSRRGVRDATEILIARLHSTDYNHCFHFP